MEITSGEAILSLTFPSINKTNKTHFPRYKKIKNNQKPNQTECEKNSKKNGDHVGGSNTDLNLSLYKKKKEKKETKHISRDKKKIIECKQGK